MLIAYDTIKQYISTMSASALYKGGFRRLLKAAKFAFEGDAKAIEAARQQLRLEFYRNKTVRNSEHLAAMLKDVEDVEEMLRFNIVQGKKNDKGNFAVSLKEEHQVTVQAGQDLPHGPELAPIDPSFIGKHVQVTKSKGTGVIDREKFKPAV